MPNPPYRLAPLRAPGSSRNCALAASRTAPAPTSVAARRCPGAGRTPATPPARASTHPSELLKRDVVGDADVGGERGHHRAVFLERELDRPTRLRLVRAVPSDGEPEVYRRVASRLRLAAGPIDGDLEGAQRHALLLEDYDHVRRRARGRGEEQQLHGRRGCGAVSIYANRRSARRAAFEVELLAPAHDDLAHVARHGQFPRRVVRPT